MAEKPSKKTVAITIKRVRIGIPKVLVVSGFKLRTEKATGLIDISLETSGQKGERVTFDPVLLGGNLDALKRYAANLATEPDDAAEREDVMVSDPVTFANIAHFSQMGGRAETVFGLFSLSDWVEATRQGHDKAPEIQSVDVLVAISSTALQKKLLLELVLLMSRKGKE